MVIRGAVDASDSAIFRSGFARIVAQLWRIRAMWAQLYKGDCIEVMQYLPDACIDMILCDLPYGTTRNKWDVLIPFDALWQAYNRIIKPNGAIVLFSQQPFTAELVMSNRKIFRYEWIWHKSTATGFLNAKKMPLKCHENVLVFYKAPPFTIRKCEQDSSRIGQHKAKQVRTMEVRYRLFQKAMVSGIQ